MAARWPKVQISPAISAAFAVAHPNWAAPLHAAPCLRVRQFKHQTAAWYLKHRQPSAPKMSCESTKRTPAYGRQKGTRARRQTPVPLCGIPANLPQRQITAIENMQCQLTAMKKNQGKKKRPNNLSPAGPGACRLPSAYVTFVRGEDGNDVLAAYDARWPIMRADAAGRITAVGGDAAAT